MSKLTTNPQEAPENKHLRFVLHYYQAGKLDTRRAIRQVVPGKVVPLWRKWAAAASFTLLLIGGAYATYVALSPAADGHMGSETPVHSPEHIVPDPVCRHFHFDNTPLSQVLQELGDYYGVTLTTAETDKRLTADFDSENLDETISMIEQVLDIKISVSQK